MEYLARETIQLLQQETPHFISPDLWPLNRADLKLVDYGIRGRTRVQDSRLRHYSDLKQRLIDKWASVSQNIIDKALDQCRKRIRVCEKAKEHHFEHLLN